MGIAVVGATLGDSEGASDGREVVGTTLGITVGDCEGRAVGSSEGDALTEGSTVGDGDMLGLD